MMKVSVIIPSYNSAETVLNCLESLTKQQIDEPFEIIVVDSSSDGTNDMVAQNFPDVRLIRLEQKTIPSKGRNIGAGKAQSEYLVFTDSDCTPEKDWLKNILKNISAGNDIIGGSVENGRPESLISRAEYFIEFREFSSSSSKREIRFLPSCNFAIKKSIFDAIGGFPEVRASEDTLFAHKLTEKGHKIVFDPAVKIKHLNRNKWRPYLKNQYILGKYAAHVRKILPMPGGFFVKIPYVFPLLPIVRTLRTLQFIFQSKFADAAKLLIDFLIVYPIFLLGSMVWSYGFFIGVRMDEDAQSYDKG